MPIYPRIHLIQHHCMVIQLVANLYRQVALSANRRAELIQLLILVA